jgi:hypothetical protein
MIITNVGTAATIVTRGLSVVDGQTNIPDRQFEHRRGAVVKITDHPAIIRMIRLLNGTDAFNAPAWTGVASIAGLTTPLSSELTKAANVQFVINTALAGAPDASDVGKGVVEIATQAEVDAGDDSGSTTAPVVVIPSRLANVIQDASYVYAADAAASDTYAITLVPALAAYAAGQSFYFRANTANTGGATLNVNGLGARNILKYTDQALETGDIEAGKMIHVVYDGTSMQLQSPVDSSLTTAMTTEVAAFFGSTDITGAEAETLTAGATSNASSLHVHPFSMEQIIPFFVNSSTTYAPTVNFATNITGSVAIVTAWVSGTLDIYRFALEQNQYVLTHTATFAGTTINEASPMVLGSYVYVEFDDNGTNLIRRYDVADLANVTSITISGTGWNTGGASFTNGTDLYVYDTTSVFNRYTISGTTATFASAITYTSAGVISNGGATCDGTSVWATANTNGAITIRKYPVAGGASSANVIRYFFPNAYPSRSQISLYISSLTGLGLAFGMTIESNAAVLASAVKLSAINSF